MGFSERLADYIAGLDGDFVAAIEAEKFVAFMAKKHPQELVDWQQARSVYFATREIGDWCRNDRARTTRQASSRAFADVAQRFEDGDDEGELAAAFRARYVIDDDDTRRHLGDMTGTDHLYVAQDYEASGQRDLMLAAFHRQVAKKLGNRRTAEVFTEAAYTELLDSVTKVRRIAAA